MATQNRTTFAKRQREQARQEKQKAKAQRKLERKLENRQATDSAGTEECMNAGVPAPDNPAAPQMESH